MRKEQDMVRDFTDDRPTMKENNQSTDRMIELLQQEMDEIKEVLDDPEHLARELVDSIFFIMTIANLKDIDLESEFREKVAYNMVRYEARFFQDGDYDESRKRVKQRERDEGDGWFYGIDV